jgi:hypothetical protein
MMVESNWLEVRSEQWIAWIEAQSDLSGKFSCFKGGPGPEWKCCLQVKSTTPHTHDARDRVLIGMWKGIEILARGHKSVFAEPPSVKSIENYVHPEASILTAVVVFSLSDKEGPWIFPTAAQLVEKTA